VALTLLTSSHTSYTSAAFLTTWTKTLRYCSCDS